jgi:predicted PurR-regulated permease PerM
LSQTLLGVAGRFTAVAFNAAQILVVLVTVFFGVTFTLMNPRPIFGAVFSLVPERHHAQTLAIVLRIGKFVPNWALATLLAMLTVGLLVFVLMWPLLGFADALVLGLIGGVLEAIPYLGPILSALPALLFALGKGGYTPTWVLVAYLGVQLLENNVIAPLIIARSMKLHSVAVIFSMLLCVAAFGVLGVLVAAPLVAILEILHDELYRKRFLPTVTDADLDRLARKALREKQSAA